MIKHFFCALLLIFSLSLLQCVDVPSEKAPAMHQGDRCI